MNNSELKKIILEEIKQMLLENYEVCIAPPFMTDKTGRIIDPYENPQAYGLRDDYDIVATGGKEPKYYGVYDDKASVPANAPASTRKGKIKNNSADLAAQKRAATASKAGVIIPGTKIKTAGTVSGEASGILDLGNGRLMVRVMIDGEPQVFIKGTGTSQIYINRNPEGRFRGFGPMPTEWYPLSKDAPSNYSTSGGKYQKISPKDPYSAFVKGGKKQPHPVHGPRSSVQVSSNFRSEMNKKHGAGWERKVKPGSRIDKDLRLAFKKGEGVTYSPTGKYPHPESEYGQIIKQISALEEKGELEKIFGKKAQGSEGPNNYAIEDFMSGQTTAEVAAAETLM